MSLRFAHAFLALMAPRTCCGCGRRLAEEEDVFCAVCMMHLPFTDFLSHPYDNAMARTFWGIIRHFEKAYALMYHEPHAHSARAVYQLKYYNKPDVGVELGVLMGKRMKAVGFTDDIDFIVPVPLAKKRERQRGFNQSEMIAQGISDATGLPAVNNVVRRTSFHGSQTQIDRWSRAENVEDAFELLNADSLRGRHVLIVDDIVTTGATVSALAKVLGKAERVRVSVASIGFAGERIYSKNENVSLFSE